MSSERKRILKFVLFGLGLGAAITTPFCFVLALFVANSDFFDVEKSVNTCFSGRDEGIMDQGIAAAINFPITYLNDLPGTISPTPHVAISFTDTGCLLFVEYRNLENNAVQIRMMISESNTPESNQVKWTCREYEDTMKQQAGFQSSCYRQIEQLVVQQEDK